ncbi:MAG TPA: type II toxin-antitoxin system VapC family toxin [Solirubrobacterales bacterium]|nr:type II toxin-antitoxin system VapC family toxin [Solirubrobacterales bacterium]
MLYLDASALVKRYVAEEESEALIAAMGAAEGWAICRVGYVETARAVYRAAGKRGVERFEADWPSFEVVEVDASLAEHAAGLAFTEDLRSLDALHLAAALLIDSGELTVATWDLRLHRAAQNQDLRVFPAELPERR